MNRFGDAGTVDVLDFIEAQPVGAGQVRLIVICAAVLFLDGFDTQAIGYVAPALARDLHLTRDLLGPVFSSSLFGIMVGALALSPLADRIGRKRLVVGCTLAFGIGALITPLADDRWTLMAIRFATGLALGGAMPNAVALTAEFSPHRRRATMVMTMFCGFSVGAAVGGLIAAALIPAFGWRAVFYVGGAAPLALVPLLAWRLPESVRFLALRGTANARIGTLLGQMFPARPLSAGTRFTAPDMALTRPPVAELFSDGRALATAMLWVVFFMSLLDIYFLSNWLPTVITDLGVTDSRAAAISTLFQIGGVVGAVTLGRWIDRAAFGALAAVYVVAAIAIAAIGPSTASIPLAAAAIFFAGFGIVGGQTGANALAAACYPTSARSTGVGWALGIGRAGSIIGPTVGGLFLAMNLDHATLFLIAAVPAALAAVASAALRPFGARVRARDVGLHPVPSRAGE